MNIEHEDRILKKEKIKFVYISEAHKFDLGNNNLYTFIQQSSGKLDICSPM